MYYEYTWEAQRGVEGAGHCISRSNPAVCLYFLGSPTEMPSLTDGTSEWALHVGILHEMHI